MSLECQPGDRLRLISTTDPYTRLRAGATGTVDVIDDLGTIHVAWDDEDGHVLGLVPGTDHFELLSSPSTASRV